MKKLLYCAAALAMAFFAGSCQQEKLEPVAENGTVTFTVKAPATIQTKAIADGKNVEHLIYEVWLTKTLGDLENDAQFLYQATTTMDAQSDGSRTATLSLDLVNDQQFTVLFWAQVDEPTAADRAYNTDKLTAVSYYKGMDKYNANDESLAAFYSVAYVNDCMHVTKDGRATGSEVVLRRPFAQLNLGTLNTSTETGSTTGYEIVIEDSNMILEKVPTTFNVVNSEVSGAETITFAMTAAPCADLSSVDAELPGFENPSYWYAGMNYVFAGNNVKLTYNIQTRIDGKAESTVNNTVYNVPLKENHRTNIIGNLLTSRTDYQIVVDAKFDTNENSGNSLVLGEGIVKNQNGDYEVSNARGLAYALNNLFKDGGNFYLTASEYDMTGLEVSAPTIPAGVVLNIYGETPVVTRAALYGVVITGLDFGALIEEVAESASVSFANITLDSDVPFVETNNGAVAFTDCANDVADSNDTATALVDGGNGYVADMTAINSMASLKEALDSGVKTINLSTTIKNTEEVVLDLKGATITGVDNNTSGNFYLIDNIGKLTIKNTAEKAATITLEAKNNRNWNSSSVVVANNPGGNLTIESGVVIEHLGGTDMAYGIDNLTNGKGTSAVTTINAATVKSPYRAVRQFLNGVEATNDLYVNAGAVIEGANKSIWMQDPSANANTGKLVVAEGATLNGDVYLTVTAGSTEWPVKVSIADSALAGESEVLWNNNIPAGYRVENVAGTWTVLTSLVVENAQDAVAALSEGNYVSLGSDLNFSAKDTPNQGYGMAGLKVENNAVLDGHGHSLTVSDAGATWDCAVYATSGVIKNITIKGAMRGIFMGGASDNVCIDNVIFENVIYTFNSDDGNKNYGVYVSNSTLNGWTSFSNAHKEVVFTNCTFAKGSGYAFCRPYNPCVFENCEFSTDMEFDTAQVADIVFKNCTYGGVKITAENAASLKTGDVTFFYNGVGNVSFE